MIFSHVLYRLSYLGPRLRYTILPDSTGGLAAGPAKGPGRSP